MCVQYVELKNQAAKCVIKEDYVCIIPNQIGVGGSQGTKLCLPASVSSSAVV